MSRRNQSRRRRAYGRRQHEVRERQASLRGEGTDDWLFEAQVDADQRGFEMIDPRGGRQAAA
jgi:hypothetical protein